MKSPLIKQTAVVLFLCIVSWAYSQKKEMDKMDIKRENFGTVDGQDVFLYTLTNGFMTAKITNYGGIVTELWVPDKKGVKKDVVLGFNKLDGYLAQHPYFGAIVGRYANRIARGKFTLEGAEYTLATNNGPNHLHGGIRGFDKRVWTAETSSQAEGVSLKLKYSSKDGEEGYPGNLSVAVTYTLGRKNEFSVSYEATTDRPTVLNLSQHSYFNLAGAGSGEILDHQMTLNADTYAVVDSTLIPTGELRSVAGTPMDFRKSHPIGARIQQVTGGYDHNYVLNRTGTGLSLAARVIEPRSGRGLEVWTTEPGIQFYTGNFLDGSVRGKEGKKYEKHFGFCLEAQHYPDSPNHPEFPSTTLRAGQRYIQKTVLKFFSE